MSAFKYAYKHLRSCGYVHICIAAELNILSRLVSMLARFRSERLFGKYHFSSRYDSLHIFPGIFFHCIFFQVYFFSFRFSTFNSLTGLGRFSVSFRFPLSFPAETHCTSSNPSNRQESAPGVSFNATVASAPADLVVSFS